MIVRRLNEKGLAAMTAFLDSLGSDAPQPFPTALLEDPASTEVLMPPVEVEHRLFETRFEVAEYLSNKFKDADLSALERDRGVWAWLALFYFEELCDKGSGGRHKPGALARWIPEGAYNRYYRHLLAGPFRIYRAHRDHPERALGLLLNKPSKMGDVVEQFSAYQQFVTNVAIVGAVTALYVDPAGPKYKRGAGGKDAGSPRRFVTVLKQFDLTFDLRSMTVDGLLNLLPKEFDRFRKAKVPSPAVVG